MYPWLKFPYRRFNLIDYSLTAHHDQHKLDFETVSQLETDLLKFCGVMHILYYIFEHIFIQTEVGFQVCIDSCSKIKVKFYVILKIIKQYDSFQRTKNLAQQIA